MGLFQKKDNRETTWIKEEHLWGRTTFRCQSCGSVFNSKKEYCPNCRAKVKKIKSDPVWVDEMEFYD